MRDGVELLFLGSGTSTGIPMIGCDCRTCASSDPRDKRLRSSLVVRWNEGDAVRQVLVDACTDLRAQALKFGLKRIDAVLFTHAHADHVHGIDELRSFNFLMRTEIPCYGSPETLMAIRNRFDYIFDPRSDIGGGRPKLSLHPVESDFALFGRTVGVLPVKHGPSNVLGYRFGQAAYITDCNLIPDPTMQKIEGVKLLVLGAVQRKGHATHFGLYEAIDAIKASKAAKGYLTHMNHDLMHAEISPLLPENISLAYDGLAESVQDRES